MADDAKTEPNRHLRLVLAEQERERSDLAHQLHDQLAQSLGAVLLGLDGLESRVHPSEAARIGALRAQLAEALSLCTELAADLRPAVLDQLGLPPALETLARRQRAEHVSVDPALAAARLEPELETEVYRTVEEALRALGAGCDLTLTLDAHGEAVLVSVRPSGDKREIDDLAQIDARMEPLGGTLQVGVHELTVRIPLAGTASVFPQTERVETPDGGCAALP
jgi:two-component system, NarL family, sensor histidine kinase DevS